MRKEKSKSGKVENKSRHSVVEKVLRREGMLQGKEVKMRNKALFIGIVAIALAGVAIGANANIISHTEASDKVNVPDVPHKINYQGYLTDAAGNPITDDLDMTFRIYDSPTGGTQLWSETQTAVHVENGLFNVILGSVNPIPGDVFPIDGSRWLETEIENQPLTPRKEIVSVAYAFKADPDDDWDGACTGEMYTHCLDDNVGIGVKDPAHHLEVKGGAAGPGALLVEANNLADFTGAMLEFNGVNRDGIVNIFAGTWDDPYITGGRPVIKLHPSTQGNNRVILMVDDYDFQKFKIRTQGIYGTTKEERMWKTGGKDVLTITQDGNVGIGTTEPQEKLHVKGRVEADGGTFARISSFYAKADSEPGITFHNTGKDGSGIDYCDWVIFAGGGGGGSYNHDLTIMRTKLPGGGPPTHLAGSVTFLGEYLGGNQWEPIKVGIGTPNPDASLTIKAGADGKVLKGYNQAGEVIVEIGEGLDYSETFPTSQDEITPGTVMVIDPVNKGFLTISTQAYDKKVAGIAAGAKGLDSGVRLGSSTEDGSDHAVALAGRVYCNVDTQYGDIELGDLLTTSPTPGHAMVVKDFSRAQGAILGKAMEGLSGGGKGQILVLVTLQ